MTALGIRKHRARKHGLRRDLLRRQGNHCAICNDRLRKGVLDHDHRTGSYRGVLCDNCNIGLGHFCDSPELLARAITYLQIPRILRHPRLSLTLSQSKMGNLGSTGHRYSSKVRKRMSEAQKKCWSECLPPWEGRKHTPESIEKMSLARKRYWDKQHEVQRFPREQAA